LAKSNEIKMISKNRRARHDYNIVETYEAGVVLTGTEVKSLRLGNTSLSESYITVMNGELFVIGWHIAPYEQGNRENVDSLRRRKLLMHKKEIHRLMGQVQQEGLSLIPLSVYFSRGYVKMEVALAKGKKLYDKRETKKKQDQERQIRSSLRRDY
jgi:SsrA-binding protein